MESVLKPSKPRCGLTGNGNSIVTRRGFHRNCMSFLMKNSLIAFQITLISALLVWLKCKILFYRSVISTSKVYFHRKKYAANRDTFSLFVGVEASATWHTGLSQWRPLSGLFVDSQRLIALSQNRTKCVKYVWLSYPTWPSRWVLCISMQWLRLKGCHVACDEWSSGEICSLHNTCGSSALSCGQPRVTSH